MAAQKKRVDVSADRSPLTDSPFASLGGIKAELPAEPAQKPAPKAEIIEEAAPPYRVARTRKGGWPISFEKRAGGKLATIIGNVSGDGAALLKTLRKLCATGGVWKEDTIELQGDHRARIETFLNQQRS